MVVPGVGETMERSSPTMRFNNVDLPTLGRPMMATSTMSGCVSSSMKETALTCARAASRRSSTPVPCSAVIGKTGTPMEWKGAALASWEGASTLLTAITKGLPVLRRSWASSSSRGVTPAWRSEEHTSELQSQSNLVCRLLLEKKKKKNILTKHITKKNNENT